MKYLAFAFLFIASSVMAKDGRYQLHTYEQFPNRALMIDTHTGKIWTDTCFKQNDKGDCELSAWSEQSIIGINTKYENVKAAQKSLEKGE